ncbi:glycosyltransferase family 2 protein [Draconibacterium mangrovi]|uniref:glycosyltransferase family 2 protein n=1 Tax=Draconibacterium mangrovi TaxID=2697469 RepID=UPI0013D4130D|nr:glycosyltransferase family 2 protein [Draconibacterium mangrovi]
MNNYRPLVSIMIPTYNQEKYVERALRSALSQNYDNLEIVVSDDCSSDNTEKIVKKYLNNGNIHYFRNETNLGRVENYHKTLYERAKGDYVLNLDGDDELIDNNFISDSIELLRKFKFTPNLVVACKRTNKEETLKYNLHQIEEEFRSISGVDFVLGLLYKYKFSHLTTLYLREKALDMNFYRSGIISSDMESLLRLALGGNVLLYNRVVGQWNYVGNNASQTIDIDKSIQNLEWITSVAKNLKEHVSTFELLVWTIKMKYFYTNGIFNQLKVNNTQKFHMWSTLFKSGLFFFLFAHQVVYLKKKVWNFLRL